MDMTRCDKSLHYTYCLHTQPWNALVQVWMVMTTVYICRERHQSHPASKVGSGHHTGQAPHATDPVPLQAQADK